MGGGTRQYIIPKEWSLWNQSQNLPGLILADPNKCVSKWISCSCYSNHWNQCKQIMLILTHWDLVFQITFHDATSGLPKIPLAQDRASTNQRRNINVYVVCTSAHPSLDCSSMSIASEVEVKNLDKSRPHSTKCVSETYHWSKCNWPGLCLSNSSKSQRSNFSAPHEGDPGGHWDR